MIYLSYQPNPSEDYLAQSGMLEIFIQAFTWGIPDAQVLDISQEEMAGYNWAKVSYTGEQDGVTWYNELYIAYTPSHIYCVCCAAPQDDFDGLRPTFSCPGYHPSNAGIIMPAGFGSLLPLWEQLFYWVRRNIF